MDAYELFAGAGGAALGLQAAGIHHLSCIERDPSAAATLRAAGFPAVEMDVEHWLDTIEGATPRPGLVVEPIDLVWSSHPCQGWSKAGHGLGDADPRDGWHLLLRAVDLLHPRWVIWENVRGAPADRWTGDLSARYAWAGARLLDAADYGIPQNRRRWFGVAGPAPIEWPRPTHHDPVKTPALTALIRDTEPWTSCGAAIGQRVVCFATVPEGHKRVKDRRVRDLSDRPSVCLGTPRGINQGGVPHVQLRPSPTITTADGQGMGSARARDRLERTIGRRKLTVSECATLQGFPPGHPFQGSSRSQYQQIGNAVVPHMAEVIGSAVLAADLLHLRRSA
jgi:DNA (cytosine-5)-methyltransferase 1